MTKTKTRDEVMAEAYWTPKEKEDLSSRYSTSLIKENCNKDDLSDKSLPSDAYVVTYKVEGAVRNDLVRCHGKVNIFDMYYDCLLYTSPSPRDKTVSRMPSSA